MVHENYKEMLAPYALSTLDREETRTLEEHLATCHDCPRELDEWQGTTAALALLAALAEPSPRVRANILERIQAHREPGQHILTGTQNAAYVPESKRDASHELLQYTHL